MSEQDFIGEAAVTAPGQISYMVRAAAPGVVGDARATVTFAAFAAAGWKTDRPLVNVGDEAVILAASA